jgi:hypothetical protein
VGILSGWSRGDGGGNTPALGGGSVGGVCVCGFKSRKTKRDHKGRVVPLSLVE